MNFREWGNRASGRYDLTEISAKLIALPGVSQELASQAVMQVAETVMTQAIADITDEINVSASYVREKFRLIREKSGRSIAAVNIAARWRPMNLYRFDARQLTVPAKNSARAKGDPSRGIPPGRKAAGFSVKEFRRGGRLVIKEAFSMPMRRVFQDGGNGIGLFYSGDTDSAMYGPSPAQMFKRWRAKNLPDIKRQLAETYAQNLRAYLAKK